MKRKRSNRDSASRGTGSSNPSPSRGESTNHRFRRRFHGLEITKEKQRVSEAPPTWFGRAPLHTAVISCWLKGIGGTLIDRPNRIEDRPDRDRLAIRFERFKKAV
jgi:hypothetical protein